MGDEEKHGTLMCEIGGEWHEVRPIAATPILEAFLPGDPPQWVNAEISIKGKLPKHFRCRSRRRLIKLLMSDKFSRDEAAAIAQMFHDCGISYRDAWTLIWPELMFL